MGIVDDLSGLVTLFADREDSDWSYKRDQIGSFMVHAVVMKERN